MNYKENRKGLLQYLGIPHHEYWSWWWFSFPIWPSCIWYAIRLRNATWFTVVNPAIEHSGYTEESKKEIMSLLPKENLPETIFIQHQKELPALLLPFPCIAKPDVGGRGRKIQTIYSLPELQEYHNQVGEDYMLQEIISYPLELGIFYAKIPSDSQGRILSLTEKGFLTVVGNGKNTIRELLQKIPRAVTQIERLSKEINMDMVLPSGEACIVEPIGNHCRGTVFINRQDKITKELEESFDRIASQIKGFHYGRFDVRAKSWEDSYQGKHIYILELNGLTSMDTHLFDPSFRLRDVLPVLLRNCHICYRIAKENLRQGVKSTPLKVILRKSLAFFNE